jgi:hypothetical protein
MNWKGIKKATLIFCGIAAAFGVLFVTTPWGFIVGLIGLAWWIIYDGVELEKFDKRFRK